MAMEIASACAVVLWSCAVATAALLVAAVVPVVAMVALWWLAGWWLEWPLWLAATGLVRALFRMVVMRGRRSFGEIRCSHCSLVRVAALDLLHILHIDAMHHHAHWNLQTALTSS